MGTLHCNWVHWENFFSREAVDTGVRGVAVVLTMVDERFDPGLA